MAHNADALTLTIRSGTTRTLTQRFITSGFSPYKVVGSAAESVDLEICGSCFKTGDSIGLCPGSNGQSPACQPISVAGKCPKVITISATPDANGCRVATVDGLSLPVGAIGQVYAVPQLKGMWLTMEFIPEVTPFSQTGPVRAVQGATQYVIEGFEQLPVGTRLKGNGITQGPEAIVLSSRVMTDAQKCYYTLATLDKPAAMNTLCTDLRTFGIVGNEPMEVKGPRAKTSAGQGTCGALQITINNNVSTAIARWGKGHVGHWTLKLNNGFSQMAATESIAIASGDLHVA